MAYTDTIIKYRVWLLQIGLKETHYFIAVSELKYLELYEFDSRLRIAKIKQLLSIA